MTYAWLRFLPIFMLLSCKLQNHFDASSVATAQVDFSTTQLVFANFSPLDVMDITSVHQQGVALDHIVSIKPYALTLAVPYPQSSYDLSFIEEVNFYVQAGDMQPLLIASGSSFSAGELFVGLDTQNVELKPYLQNGMLDITTTVTFSASNAQPSGDVFVQANLVLDITLTQSTIALRN